MKTPQEIARERAEIMLAFADGQEIEWARKRTENWAPDPYPAWDWDRFDYRVKPRLKVPRRASVASDDLPSDQWVAAWPIDQPSVTFDGFERVEMIELTPEVAAAILAAGIPFEDADKWKEGAK